MMTDTTDMTDTGPSGPGSDHRRIRGGDTLVPVFLVLTAPAEPGDGEGPTGSPADPTLRTPRQVVPGAGFEPACLSAAHFECAVSACSTNPASARSVTGRAARL